MARRTVEIITCDLCRKQTHVQQHQVSVIFHTDQTDWAVCKPYLSTEIVDFCNSCYQELLTGKSIHGSGTQGHNRYYFK